MPWWSNRDPVARKADRLDDPPNPETAAAGYHDTATEIQRRKMRTAMIQQHNPVIVRADCHCEITQIQYKQKQTVSKKQQTLCCIKGNLLWWSNQKKQQQQQQQQQNKTTPKQTNNNKTNPWTANETSKRRQRTSRNRKERPPRCSITVQSMQKQTAIMKQQKSNGSRGRLPWWSNRKQVSKSRRPWWSNRIQVTTKCREQKSSDSKSRLSRWSNRKSNNIKADFHHTAV